MAMDALAAAFVGVTLVFSSGGTMRGVLLADDGRELRLEVDGGEVEFARDAVAEVRREPNAHSEFKSRQARTDPGDAAALWDLARWASDNGLPGWARLSAQQVLRLDPGHEGARATLGWQLVDGAWRSGADLMRAKGYVRHEGRWMTSAEREAAVLEDSRERERPGTVWPPRPPPVVVNVIVFAPQTLFLSRLDVPTRVLEPFHPGPAVDRAWRPEPFRFGSAVLGIPPMYPVGARFGYDPLR